MYCLIGLTGQIVDPVGVAIAREDGVGNVVLVEVIYDAAPAGPIAIPGILILLAYA